MELQKAVEKEVKQIRVGVLKREEEGRAKRVRDELVRKNQRESERVKIMEETWRVKREKEVESRREEKRQVVKKKKDEDKVVREKKKSGEREFL
jgi:hypothetical protein